MEPREPAESVGWFSSVAGAQEQGPGPGPTPHKVELDEVDAEPPDSCLQEAGDDGLDLHEARFVHLPARHVEFDPHGVRQSVAQCGIDASEQAQRYFEGSART